MAKKKKSKKSKKRNDRALAFGFIVVMLLFIIVIYKIITAVITANDSYDLSGQTYYQYFYGIMEEYSGELEVAVDDDEITLTLESGQVIYLDSTPIYYKDILGKVLFAQEMEIIIPNEGSYKLNKFTNITLENNNIYVKNYNSNNTVEVESAFLYDGNNLYFFLDDTTVTIGDEQYELSALSYVIVDYKQNVEIYDYDTDTYTVIQDEELLEHDVYATNNAKGYTINMSVDSLNTTKSQTLLITNINNLTEFDY